jgi:hypothetical protein
MEVSDPEDRSSIFLPNIRYQRRVIFVLMVYFSTSHFNIDSVLLCLHRVNIGSVAGASGAYSASIFRAKASRVSEFFYLKMEAVRATEISETLPSFTRCKTQ